MSRSTGLTIFCLAILVLIEVVLFSRFLARPSVRLGLLERALQGEARIVDLTGKGGESLSAPGEAEHASPSWHPTWVVGAWLEEASGSRSDLLRIRRLIAPAAVVDVPEETDGRVGQIDRNELECWESECGPIPSGAIVACRAGKGAEGAGSAGSSLLSADTVQFLVEERRIAGIGFESRFLDRSGAIERQAEQTVLDSGGILVFGLSRLKRLPRAGAVLLVLPLSRDTEPAMPVRVFAVAP